MLLNTYGLSTEVFANANAFLERFNVDEQGCLIVDLCMCEVSGAELLERLRARGSTLPAVVVTAHTHHPLADRAKAAGARAILGKPFRETELLRELTRAFAANELPMSCQ